MSRRRRLFLSSYLETNGPTSEQRALRFHLAHFAVEVEDLLDLVRLELLVGLERGFNAVFATKYDQNVPV